MYIGRASSPATAAPVWFSLASLERRRRCRTVGCAGRVNGRSIVVRRVVVALAALAVILPAIAARADAFVYWSGNPRAGEGFIGRAPLTGGSPSFLLSNRSGALRVAFDTNFIYWANGRNFIGRPSPNATNRSRRFIGVIGP